MSFVTKWVNDKEASGMGFRNWAPVNFENVLQTSGVVQYKNVILPI